MEEFDKFYNKSLRFLSFRPRSEKEVLDYLKKNKTQELDIVKILNKLREYKFIDDLAFAKWFIENRRKGKRLVLLELAQKGISKEIIEEASSTFDLVKKEEELLSKLIEKKWKSVSRNPEKAYEKMMGFLLRRGFDYDTVKKAVKEKIKTGSSVDD